MKTTALENAEMENDIKSTTNTDFSEGVSRMLSGMCANMSRAMCSSPMTHLIVSNDGSRSEFSYGFTNLLLTQAVDVLEGKEGEFRIRTNFSKTKNEKVFWPDSSLDNYRYRPPDRIGMCYYEFVAKYEQKNKKFKQIDKQKKNEDTMMIDAEAEESLAEMDGDCDDDSQVQELRINQYPFIDEHPGHDFSHLQERIGLF